MSTKPLWESSSSPLPPLPPSYSPGSGSCSGVNYIEHPVSRMDTLAGIAIKYGVEVGDIKRINGLVTDIQMFGLKSLHIPLPGRHPPSSSFSNDSDTPGSRSTEQTPPHHRQSNLLESFQSLKLKSSPQWQVSPAMSSLQRHYGLKPVDQKIASGGFKMDVYQEGHLPCLENGLFPKRPISSTPLSHLRKSSSLVNCLSENGKLRNNGSISEARDGDFMKWNETLVKRRQRSVADFTSRTPEMLLKEDNSSGGGFSAITGKGLALRSKAANRTSSGAETEAGWSNMIPKGLGCGSSVVFDSVYGVRKSSSTPSLQDQNSTPSYIRPTSKRSLKQDMPALPTAASRRPMFDGLSNPMITRRNKAALD